MGIGFNAKDWEELDKEVEVKKDVVPAKEDAPVTKEDK